MAGQWQKIAVVRTGVKGCLCRLARALNGQYIKLQSLLGLSRSDDMVNFRQQIEVYDIGTLQLLIYAGFMSTYSR